MQPRPPSPRPMPFYPHRQPPPLRMRNHRPMNIMFPKHHIPFGRQAAMPQRNGGGLLSKLFSRGAGGQNPSRSMPAFGGMGAVNSARGASFLQTVANPSAINNFLTNTQKVLNTAQQIGPLVQQVQQYGPLVKNLPAMWRIYKGMKNATEAKDTEEESTAGKTAAEEQALEEQTEEAKTVEKEGSQKEKTTRISPRDSVPKMYI